MIVKINKRLIDSIIHRLNVSIELVHVLAAELAIIAR